MGKEDKITIGGTPEIPIRTIFGNYDGDSVGTLGSGGTKNKTHLSSPSVLTQSTQPSVGTMITEEVNVKIDKLK